MLTFILGGITIVVIYGAFKLFRDAQHEHDHGKDPRNHWK